MAKEDVDAYKKLLFELELLRPLSDEAEADFAEILDDVWQRMTREEQYEVEQPLDMIPSAPEDLNLVDAVGIFPRKLK
jgi:hypothetical protein